MQGIILDDFLLKATCMHEFITKKQPFWISYQFWFRNATFKKKYLHRNAYCSTIAARFQFFSPPFPLQAIIGAVKNVEREFSARLHVTEFVLSLIVQVVSHELWMRERKATTFEGRRQFSSKIENGADHAKQARLSSTRDCKNNYRWKSQLAPFFPRGDTKSYTHSDSS